jgi:hypothetical protein
LTRKVPLTAIGGEFLNVCFSTAPDAPITAPALARKLSGMDRKAVELALEVEGAQVWGPPIWVLQLSLSYGLAGVAGFAIGTRLVWSAVGGVALGLVIASTVCVRAISAKLESMQEVNDSRLFEGVWLKIGIVLGGLGLLAGLIRRSFSL